jgi:hypothetical protein
LALVLGAALWFGIQAVSGLDNFSDSVNPVYFIALYSVGFILGLVIKTRPSRVAFLLAISQVACYIVYPNVAGKLGNLFPIAAGYLFVSTLPVVAFAHLAFLLRTKVFKY